MPFCYLDISHLTEFDRRYIYWTINYYFGYFMAWCDINSIGMLGSLLPFVSSMLLLLPNNFRRKYKMVASMEKPWQLYSNQFKVVEIFLSNMVVMVNAHWYAYAMCISILYGDGDGGRSMDISLSHLQIYRFSNLQTSLRLLMNKIFYGLIWICGKWVLA